MYQEMGFVHPYETEDIGRAKVTGGDAHRFVFKVPSLREIEKTGPYFHDGSVETLPEAVRLLGWHPFGKKLGEEESQRILTFLGAFTREVDEAYGAKSDLPASSEATPKADPS